MPALFQGIFLTQGLNSRLLCLLHWQVGIFGNKQLYFSTMRQTLHFEFNNQSSKPT